MILAHRKLQTLNEVTRHEIQNIVTGLVGMVDMAQAARTDKERDTLFRQKKELIAALQKQIEFTEEFQEVGTNLPCWQGMVSLIPTFSSLNVSVSPDIADLEIYADPLIAKVFTGLAKNSIRHGHHATGIRVHAEEDRSGLALFFEDNGAGVPRDKKETVFERKFGNRAGMGLFLIREILGITGITIS